MAACLAIVGCNDCSNKQTETEEKYVSNAPTFDTDSAYEYIRRQCSFGPRVMNSVAHDSCGDYIARQFKEYGATIQEQLADLKLYDGTTVKSRNIIASFFPEKQKRIMICSHWDSRPWADHDIDESKHKNAIDGANDGASGVGVLLELARLFSHESPAVGVDLICFDAEDCGTPEWAESDDDTEHTWCLGSQYWAENHHVDGYSPEYAILLDMVAGPGSVFYKEGFSMKMAPSVVDKVWAAGQRIGYSNYFVSDQGGYVTDDHLPVNKSGIPCADIIATDREGGSFCRTWHTTSDNINNIDKATLKAVGQTITEVVYTAE